MMWRCLKSGGCSGARTAMSARTSKPRNTRTRLSALRVKNAAWPLRSPASARRLSGAASERDAKFDACDLKGIVEEFLEQFGVRGVTFTRRAESTALFLESATIALGGKLPLGEMGQLSPALAKKYDLRDAVFLAELNLDQLLARRNPAKSFKPLPQFPAIRRDVAMLVPEATTHEAVLQTVKTGQAGESRKRRIVRRVPRQERAGRSEEPGLRLHLSRRGQDVDRCRSRTPRTQKLWKHSRRS